MMLLKNMLPQLGIEPERLRLEWISASEGTKFQSTVNDFIEKIRELGPLHWNSRLGDKK
jgi:F420-non-reducing hydrogenase iron-sulfur subunit